MKILKWILIVIIAIIAIFLIYSASQPSKMEVSKSITIEASSSAVFAQITDFNSWNQWAVWNQKDPNMKVEITGEAGTVGAKSQWWSDHPEVGNGSQKIVEVRANEYIKTEMRFDGWDKASYSEFIFSEEGGATTVEWTFDGAETAFYMNFMNSLMAPMIEASYVTSLSQLKELIESTPAPVIEMPENVELVETEAISIIAIRDTTTSDGIGNTLGKLYAELSIYLESQEGLEMAGMPIGIYHSYSLEKVDMEAAFQVTGTAVGNDRISAREIPAGKAIKGIHYGSYEESVTMHEAIRDYAKASNTELTYCWELYANDPTTVEPEAIETHIHYPIK